MFEIHDKVNKRVLILSLLDVLVLSFGHATNIGGIILIGLVGFAAIVLLSPKSIFLPIMLFYLPWSPVMKFSPGNFSFYTIIVSVFFIILLLSKIDNERKKILKLDNILIALILVIFTLIVKLLSGYSISMSYIMFIMMLVFMPTYLNAYKRIISFEWCIIFFSIGIISAGLASKILMNYSHMMQYIDVYEWEDAGLIRLSGFYGDANFYSAHILVAICGLLIIAINKQLKKSVLLFFTAIVLIYFGLLSVSKMFLLVLLAILGIWIIAVLFQRGKIETKIGTVCCVAVGALFILSSGIFADQINMYLIRFGMVDSTSSLTTGRSEIFLTYLSFLGENTMAMMFGQGYTDVFAGNLEKASHNTVVQAIYQLGCFGSFLLIIWIFQLRKAVGKVKRTHFKSSNRLQILALAVACFAPWLSVDILFFDEFFYITALFFVGRNYIEHKGEIIQKSC